jgi:hypothetical protein
VERTLDDPDGGFVDATEVGGSAVLVAFGGLSFRGGPPPFEFVNLFSESPIGKVFVRDLDQCFYQRGVRGLGRSINEVAVSLEELLAGRNRRVFVGASAGGYAALIFGSMLRVDHVVAMSPQTFLGGRLRRLHNDRRFAMRIQAAQHHALSRRDLDVKHAMRRRGGKSQFHVYYPNRHVLDSRHATRLRRLPGVDLQPRDSAEHTFVRDMRDDGSLKQMLTALVLGED